MPIQHWWTNPFEFILWNLSNHALNIIGKGRGQWPYDLIDHKIGLIKTVSEEQLEHIVIHVALEERKIVLYNADDVMYAARN
jgi:hypothetical protein